MTTTETSTAVTRTNGKGITALIANAAPRLTPLLPDDLTIEKLQQIVFFESKKNPALLDCSPETIVSAVARALRSGLELGDTAYLIPYGKTCTFVADYKGLAQLMIASRAVRAVEMEAVREKDEFSFELGLNAHLRHRPAAAGGKITHAYVILRLPGGMSTFKVMTAEDIEAIRLKHSKQWKSGPLPAWYATKTVLRQIAKTMPKDKRLAQFYAALELDEKEEFQAPVAEDRPAHVDDDGVDHSTEDAEVLPDEEEDDLALDQEIVASEAGELPLGSEPRRQRSAVRDGGR